MEQSLTMDAANLVIGLHSRVTKCDRAPRDIQIGLLLASLLTWCNHHEVDLDSALDAAHASAGASDIVVAGGW